MSRWRGEKRGSRPRRRRLSRRWRATGAVACAAGALVGLAAGESSGGVPGGPGRSEALLAQADLAPGAAGSKDAPRGQESRPIASGAPGTAPDDSLRRHGRRLFIEGCSSCHGFDARGVPGRGPSLRGAGAASADFYLSTGRMPLDDPQDEPVRNPTFYRKDEQRALVAYIGGFGGPSIPEVHPERGDLPRGRELFAEHCAGCHQVVAAGGALTGARVPDLDKSSATSIGEAIEIGPYLMPHFRHLKQDEVDSIARYVEWTKNPRDEGGWPIGHIGPVPEGLVTFLLGMVSLVMIIRLIGERTTP